VSNNYNQSLCFCKKIGSTDARQGIVRKKSNAAGAFRGTSLAVMQREWRPLLF
jgi:hypothetical protein